MNQSILKFLAFEQVFKNSLTASRWVEERAALTSIPRENPRLKLEDFVILHDGTLRHIGADLDVPAGILESEAGR